MRMVLLAGILFGGLTPAAACAICFSGIKVTIGQKIDSSAEVVLAQPTDESGRYRIVEVIKGKVDDRIIDMVMSTPDRSRTYLVLRNPLSTRWESQGAIGVEYADWLKKIAVPVTGRPAVRVNSLELSPLRKTLTTAEWLDRVAVAAVNLETTDPLAAEIAYGEISRAPYGVLRSLKTRIEAKRVSSWVNDPNLVSRRATYTLLLGIVGGSDDAAALEQRLDLARSAKDADNLSAMLAADLELRGQDRVAWVEKVYLTDPQRALAEIEAALLALSVQGEADATIPRELVIKAYRSFILARKPMAGFVAMELADWGAWEVTADYIDIIKSKSVKDPAGEFAILSYLNRSPVAQQAVVSPAGRTQ